MTRTPTSNAQWTIGPKKLFTYFTKNTLKNEQKSLDNLRLCTLEPDSFKERIWL